MLIVQVDDATSGAFVPDAQVRVPSIGRIARTKWDGEASFAGLPRGRYRVEVRAIGYAPGNVDVAVGDDSRPVHFDLERVTPGLDTIRVTATATTRGLREFEDRRRHGLGRFFGDSALAEHYAKGTGLFLATIPGFRGGRYRDGCAPRFYLDGFELKAFSLEAIRLQDLAGVEVHSPSTVPVQYRTYGSELCAVILLWTKW